MFYSKNNMNNNEVCNAPNPIRTQQLTARWRSQAVRGNGDGFVNTFVTSGEDFVLDSGSNRQPVEMAEKKSGGVCFLF